jgi:predicted DNA-binding transcriptional regulator YafY
MTLAPQVKRIIKMLELFSMGRKLTAAQLFAYFDQEYSLRTLQRDLLTIQEAGIPLEMEREKGKENIWSFPPEYRRMIMPQIERNELLTMHILKAFLKSFRQTTIESDLDNLLNKIEEIAPGEIYMELGEIDDLVWDQDVGHYNYDQTDGILNQAIDLIVAKKWATVTYRSSGQHEQKTYDIFPSRIFQYKGVLYLAAYHPWFDQYFALTLHRIIKIISAEKDERPVPDFDLADFRRNRFGVFAGETEQVELEIESEYAHYFKDRIWHPSQQISTKKDGTLLIKMEVPVSPELVTWILGWHTAIKVIKPGSLVNEITQKLEETLKTYDPPRPARQ